MVPRAISYRRLQLAGSFQGLATSALESAQAYIDLMRMVTGYLDTGFQSETLQGIKICISVAAGQCMPSRPRAASVFRWNCIMELPVATC